MQASPSRDSHLRSINLGGKVVHRACDGRFRGMILGAGYAAEPNRRLVVVEEAVASGGLDFERRADAWTKSGGG
jgi:hypothetical protein